MRRGTRVGRLMRAVLVCGACLAAFWGGVSLACDGNYGSGADLTDCVSIDEYVQEAACIQEDPSTKRCRDCTRELFWCLDDGVSAKVGPAYNCGAPGVSCQ